MRPLLEPRPLLPPLHSPAQTFRHFQDSDGGWASNSQCGLTDRQRAGTSRPPKGKQTPDLGPQRTRRAQAPPHTLPATSSSSSALLPHQLSRQGLQRHGDPQAGQATPKPRAPRTWLWRVLLARGPHFPHLCSPHLLHTVKKNFSTLMPTRPGRGGGTDVANHPQKKPAPLTRPCGALGSRATGCSPPSRPELGPRLTGLCPLLATRPPAFQGAQEEAPCPCCPRRVPARRTSGRRAQEGSPAIPEAGFRADVVPAACHGTDWWG